MGFCQWSFSGNPPPRGGAGGILNLSTSHTISFKARVGQETNNFCELMALKLVLMLAREHGVNTNTNIWRFTPCNSVDETRVNPEKFHTAAFVS
jgi:ribonuclease HI